MRTILLAAAAVASLGTALPAAAQESVAVPYSDLNLATIQGQRALEFRVNRAARQVCQIDVEETGTRIRSAAKVECYRQARLRAGRTVAALIAADQRGG